MSKLGIRAGGVAGGPPPWSGSIAVTLYNSPLIQVYPWSAGFGTKYANPSTLPGGARARSTAFSPSGTALAVGGDASPFIQVYPWSAGFGTKYANPSTLPKGTYGGAGLSSTAFSPSGAALAVGTNSSPFIQVYPWSAGFGTKYANPSTLPGGGVYGTATYSTAFSPSGTALAVAGNGTPYIQVYPWSAGFGTKYANPLTLPGSAALSTAFSPSGDALAVASDGSPLIQVYPWSAGFGTKYANPSTLPGNFAYGTAFSPSGDALAVSSDGSPRIQVYPWSAGFGTKYADPSILLPGVAYGTAFSP